MSEDYSGLTTDLRGRSTPRIPLDAAALPPSLIDRAPFPDPVTPMVAYPFPLRPDLLLSLELPAALTRDDVARLCRWLVTIPMDDE